jgi:hypothetical protein
MVTDEMVRAGCDAATSGRHGTFSEQMRVAIEAALAVAPRPTVEQIKAVMESHIAILRDEGRYVLSEESLDDAARAVLALLPPAEESVNQQMLDALKELHRSYIIACPFANLAAQQARAAIAAAESAPQMSAEGMKERIARHFSGCLTLTGVDIAAAIRAIPITRQENKHG